MFKKEFIRKLLLDTATWTIAIFVCLAVICLIIHVLAILVPIFIFILLVFSLIYLVGYLINKRKGNH